MLGNNWEQDVSKNMTFINSGKFRFFLQVSKHVFIRPKPLTKIILNSKLRGPLYIFQSLLKHQPSSNLLRLEGFFQSFRRLSDTEKPLLPDPCIFKKIFAKFCFPVELRFQRFEDCSKFIR